MTLKKDFALRQVAGTWVVLPLGQATLDFNGMLKLNDSGAMLWKVLAEGGSIETLAGALTDIYEVTYTQALTDAEAFVEMLRQAGCIEA